MSRQWQFWQFVSLLQGVMRIRKRVTLMVLIVSLVFAVCWLTDASNFILSDFSVVRNSLPIALTNTLILFNSAINPIVYALVNQRFRRKFKSMICCFSRRTRNIVNPTFPLTNPTQTALSRDWLKRCLKNNNKRAQHVPFHWAREISEISNRNIDTATVIAKPTWNFSLVNKTLIVKMGH